MSYLPRSYLVCVDSGSELTRQKGPWSVGVTFDEVGHFWGSVRPDPKTPFGTCVLVDKDQGEVGRGAEVSCPHSRDDRE